MTVADDKVDYNAIADILDIAKKEDGERRKKRDLITQLPSILALISGTLVFAVWLIWNYANPNPPGANWGWLSFFGDYTVQIRPWPRVLVNIAYIMLLISVGLCIIAHALDRMRMKRKTDRYSWSVFFIGALAVITLTVFLVQFIPMNILGRW